MNIFIIVLVVLGPLIAPVPVWAGGASAAVGLAFGAFDVAVRAASAAVLVAPRARSTTEAQAPEPTQVVTVPRGVELPVPFPGLGGEVMGQPATGNVVLDSMVLVDSVLRSGAQLGNVLPGNVKDPLYEYKKQWPGYPTMPIPCGPVIGLPGSR
jgi:hypothetical protein